MNETPLLFYCLQVIGFSDGGSAEVRILKEGTREECEEVADKVPDVVYAGPRPNPEGLVVVMSKAEYERRTQQDIH